MPESLDKAAMDRRYEERCRARRELLSAIGLDASALPVRERAAIEALAGEILGPAVQLAPASARAPLGGRAARALLYAQAYTIQGGTDNILRNFIATRGLGLPAQ